MISLDGQSVIEVDELIEHYNESGNRIPASRCESHPMMRAFFNLQLFIGMFACIAVMQPLFVFMSADPVAMQLTLFIMSILMSGVVAGMAHEARIEEMLFLIRSRSYGASGNLGSGIPIAILTFASCLMMQLVANMVSARVGALSAAVHVMISAITACSLFLAIAAVQRQRNQYIINDL